MQDSADCRPVSGEIAFPRRTPAALLRGGEDVMPRVSIAFAMLSMTCSSAFRPVAHPSSVPPALSNAAAPSIRNANVWSHGMLPSIRRQHQGRASVHMDLGLADTVLSSEALWTLVLTVRLHAPRPPSHTLLTSPFDSCVWEHFRARSCSSVSPLRVPLTRSRTSYRSHSYPWSMLSWARSPPWALLVSSSALWM